MMTLCAAALLSSMGTMEEEEYHPSQGHQTQPHHPAKEELWERIRSEAWSNAVSYGAQHAALDICIIISLQRWKLQYLSPSRPSALWGPSDWLLLLTDIVLRGGPPWDPIS